ncbi:MULTISPECIES: hypothetical protein [unclassified Oceanispirochaeta]|uniref:hypothetical protein n=1 Tax=unclassified Oceanispirochaeta TaxID=2635722 RepID=UPI000E08CE0E|nr:MULTISPECIES: hypothetical protein [unclassified Oceanispirochaeta]MBF9015954.1 hypothetical protein [Oceanispirochaeta sp. M2]NPD72417.1 hypothetical protein [Oceanispirochaeta sp. M1]RDG32185.1 hypothetical protein DV872_09915 [Oceanispirochaeta sp. M1]
MGLQRFLPEGPGGAGAEPENARGLEGSSGKPGSLCTASRQKERSRLYTPCENFGTNGYES